MWHTQAQLLILNTSDAAVNVIIRRWPEGVVGVGIERVVQEIVIAIGPKQRSNEANHYDREETMTIPGSKLR